MEIHRYEKVWIAISLLFIVGLIGSIVYGVTVANVGTNSDSRQQVDANHLDGTEFGNPGGHWVGPNHYVVYVVGQQWRWKPGTSTPIMVPTNTTVTFYVTSADVVHGFQVVGSKVNVMAIPGQVTKFTTEFEQPKSYGIVCNEYCGAAHQNMEGQLVAVPRDTLSQNDTTNTTTSNTSRDMRILPNSADVGSSSPVQFTASGDRS